MLPTPEPPGEMAPGETQAKAKESPPSTKICQYCGKEIRADMLVCPDCRRYQRLSAAASQSEMGTQPVYYDRPGCLTVYAILMGLFAVAVLLVGGYYAYATVVMTEGITWWTTEHIILHGLTLIGPVVLVGGIQILMAWGLWEMKKWARILAIIMQGLGLFYVLRSFNQIPVTLVGLAIGGYIIYWFVANGKYFSVDFVQIEAKRLKNA